MGAKKTLESVYKGFGVIQSAGQYGLKQGRNNENLQQNNEWMKLESEIQAVNEEIAFITLAVLPPLLNLIYPVVQVLGGLTNHLSIITPLLLGFGGAFAIFQFATRWGPGIKAAGVAMKDFVSDSIKILRYGAEEANKINKQREKNKKAVVPSNPFTLKAMGLMGIVGIVYSVASAIADLTGVANSGLGVICGAVSFVFQVVKNSFFWFLNVVFGIASVLEVIGQIFSPIVVGMQAAFFDACAAVDEFIVGIIKAFNNLPFIDIDVSGWEQSIKENRATAEAYWQKAEQKALENDDLKSIGEAFKAGRNTFKVFEDGWAGDAFQAGAAWGDSKAGQLSGMFDSFGGVQPAVAVPSVSVVESASSGVYGTTDAQVVCSLDDDTVGLMRQLVEKESSNEYTTNVQLHMVNNLSVKETVDVDRVVHAVIVGVQEAVAMGGERSPSARLAMA